MVCPECGKGEFEKTVLKNEGTLLTYTIIRVGSDKFSIQTPYAVGIVALEDGINVTTQIADVNFEQLKIGQKVKLVFRKIQDEGKSGLHCYGYKAVII